MANFIQGSWPPLNDPLKGSPSSSSSSSFLSQPLSRGQTIRTAKHPNGGLDPPKKSACHQMKSGASEGNFTKISQTVILWSICCMKQRCTKGIQGALFIRSFVFVDSPTWRTILGEPFITDISSPNTFCPRASTSPRNVMGRGARRGKERDGDGGGANAVPYL